MRLQGEKQAKISVIQFNSKTAHEKVTIHLVFPVLKTSVSYIKKADKVNLTYFFENFTKFLIRGGAAPQYKSGNV